jgi:hypothetical protein
VLEAVLDERGCAILYAMSPCIYHQSARRKLRRKGGAVVAVTAVQSMLPTTPCIMNERGAGEEVLCSLS